MLGKKKYTQAELDAAVAVGKRAAELDAQATAEHAERQRDRNVKIVDLRTIARVAPPSLIFCGAFVDARGLTQVAIRAENVQACMEELWERGWRP